MKLLCRISGEVDQASVTPDENFLADVTVVNAPAFEGLSAEALREQHPGGATRLVPCRRDDPYQYRESRPDRLDTPGNDDDRTDRRLFRVAPFVLWSVENNINLAGSTASAKVSGHHGRTVSALPSSPATTRPATPLIACDDRLRERQEGLAGERDAFPHPDTAVPAPLPEPEIDARFEALTTALTSADWPLSTARTAAELAGALYGDESARATRFTELLAPLDDRLAVAEQQVRGDRAKVQ